MTSQASFLGFNSFKLSGVKVTSNVLGRGSYATVLELKYKEQKCAGKKVHDILLAQGNETYALRRFEEECCLLSKVHHPNIVQFLGVYFQKNSHVPILVMEFLPTNLTTCIEQHGILPNEISYSILHDVASGLHYLHSQTPLIVHRDLSSNNILLTSDFTVAKISDLGVARILNKTPFRVSKLTGTPGTPAYMPPEVMGANPVYDKTVDNFSYGILMIHMFSGQLPEAQVGPIRMEGDKMIPVSEAERREVFLQAITDDNPLIELIQRCISNNPQLRPATEDIVAYLAGLVQVFPAVSGSYLTLGMPTRTANNSKKKKSKTAHYDDVMVECENEESKPVEKEHGHNLVVKRAPRSRSGSSGKNRQWEKEKVRISWAQKKIRKAGGFVSQMDQSKVALIGTVKKEPKTSSACYPIHIVKYDYESCTSNDMSLKRGDKLCIIDTSNENWWLACSPDTGKEGYIPSNYVTKLTNPVYTAVQDYVSQKDGELSFKKGDKLYVIHAGSGHLWFARSQDTGKEGNVPWNYLAEPTYPIYTAKYGYVSSTDSDLSFKTSEQLCIIYADDKDWWFARSLQTGMEGFVPSNYVKKVIYPIYAAMFDYQSRTDDDLSIGKSDILCIINADKRDWWYARSKETGNEGYVPSNYIAQVNSLNVHKWYSGDISRKEAERQLFEEGNEQGSFLIRESESYLGGYTLSVREKEKVRHYKIWRDERGALHFFITEKVIFKSIPELVSYYQSWAGSQGIVLGRPCISSHKPPTGGLSKQTNKKWDIDRSQLRLVNELGVGSFAHVYNGLWNGKVAVAIKELKPDVIVSVSEFLREVDCMRLLRHPKLVQVYAVCSQEGPVYVITELMKHGNLLEYLHSAEGRSLKLHHLIDVASQVVEGMTYLEERDYVHHDLCAKNILLGKNLVCKVADFGFAQIVDDGVRKSLAGSKFRIKWTAPEVVMGNEASIKSDVWSFGVLLFEIITYGRFPYPDLSDEETITKLQRGYRMPQPKECSYIYYNIMLKCWREEPENRPAFEALQWELEEFLESTRL